MALTWRRLLGAVLLLFAAFSVFRLIEGFIYAVDHGGSAVLWTALALIAAIALGLAWLGRRLLRISPA